MTVFALQIEYQYGTETGEQAIASLATALERAAEQIDDFGRYVFPRLIPLFEEAEREQFAAEGRGPLAGSWAALSVKYAKWKQAHFPGRPILERTGRLQAALTSSAPGALRAVSKREFDFGTIGIRYASFHQTGTSRMVPRLPFDFGPEFEAKLEKEFQLGILDAIRAADLEATES